MKRIVFATFSSTCSFTPLSVQRHPTLLVPAWDPLVPVPWVPSHSQVLFYHLRLRRV